MRRFIYERSATNIRDWSLAYSFICQLTEPQSYVWMPFNRVSQKLKLGQNVEAAARPNFLARSDTVCSGKIVFLHNFLQLLPRLHCCKRSSKLSTQCKCTVTPIGWYFFVQLIAAKCWRGGEFFEKNTILNEHPVVYSLQHQ